MSTLESAGEKKLRACRSSTPEFKAGIAER